MVRARLVFADGEEEVEIGNANANDALHESPFQASGQIACLRGSLIGWFQANCERAAEPFDMKDPLAKELANHASSLLNELPGEETTSTSATVFRSLIYRSPGEKRSYASTVHRDVDEAAAANAPPGTRFFNVWVPLTSVTADPLALLLPETADFERDAAPFRNLSDGDRTSLRYNPAQRWVFFPGLGPGDAIVWRSEKVYHAAFHDEGHPAALSRRSVDLRLWRVPRVFPAAAGDAVGSADALP
ncbi:unnamed protein product [Phaeothamnion confervicola]